MIDWNWKSFSWGIAIGMIGLGLQNINPYEPRDITHLESILLGLVTLFVYYIITPLIKFAVYLWKSQSKAKEKEIDL